MSACCPSSMVGSPHDACWVCSIAGVADTCQCPIVGSQANTCQSPSVSSQANICQCFLVGGPVNICQWLPVGGPAGASSCSSVGGPADNWSHLGVAPSWRPNQHRFLFLGWRPGRGWPIHVVPARVPPSTPRLTVTSYPPSVSLLTAPTDPSLAPRLTAASGPPSVALPRSRRVFQSAVQPPEGLLVSRGPSVFAACVQSVPTFVFPASLQRAFVFASGFLRVPAFAYALAAGFQRASVIASAGFQWVPAYTASTGFQWVPAYAASAGFQWVPAYDTSTGF